MTHDEDDWTLARGWAKAAVHIPLRAFGAVVMAWLGFLLLRLLINALEKDVGLTISVIGGAVVCFFAVGAGLVSGLVMSHRLTERTGLIGTHMIAPVCLTFLLGLVGIFNLSAFTPPEWLRWLCFSMG